MVMVNRQNDRLALSPDEGCAIVNDFVDMETGYRIVEEICGTRPDRFIRTTTIDAESGQIVPPADRMPQAPATTVQPLGDREIVAERMRDARTGAETVRESLRVRATGEVLTARERSAFLDEAPVPLDAVYRARAEEQRRAEETVSRFRFLPRERQIEHLIDDMRKARRAAGEIGEDENRIFDPKNFAKYRAMAPRIDGMIEEIFRGVFIACLPEAEADARRRLGLRGKP